MTKEYFIYKLLSLNGFGNVKVNTVLNKIRADYSDISIFINEYLTKNSLNRYLTELQIEEFYKEDNQINHLITLSLSRGIKFLSIDSELYPHKLIQNLNNSTPPILTVKGNVQLLNKLSVGFCGSRKASSIGIEVAKDCSEQLAQNNIVTISGYAAGIDQMAHLATLNANGETIIILPEGILNFKVRTDFKNFLNLNNTLVISQFLPNSNWSVRNAMERNKLIVSLSSVMILIESGETGGSMDAGRTALKLKHKLYAPVYQGMPENAIGNEILIKEGAFPIKKSKSTNKANLKDLFIDLGLGKYHKQHNMELLM